MYLRTSQSQELLSLPTWVLVKLLMEFFFYDMTGVSVRAKTSEYSIMHTNHGCSELIVHCNEILTRRSSSVFTKERRV